MKTRVTFNEDPITVMSRIQAQEVVNHITHNPEGILLIDLSSIPDELDIEEMTEQWLSRSSMIFYEGEHPPIITTIEEESKLIVPCVEEDF